MTAAQFPDVVDPTIEQLTKELVNTHIAGLGHYDAKKYLQSLKAGMPLILKMEPTNAYDPFAIEVFLTDSIKLGYVPAKFSRIFSVLMKNGVALTAYISAVRIVAITSVKPYPLTLAICLK